MQGRSWNRCAALMLSAGLAAAGWAQSGPDLALHLRAGMVDTSAGAPVATLAALAGTDQRHVIQLDGPMTAAKRTALLAAGVELLDYVPTNAWIVSLRDADAAAVAGLGFVRWHATFDGAWKLDPDIGARELVTPQRLALRAAGRAELAVVFFQNADGGAVARAFAAIDGVELVDRTTLAGNQVAFVRMDVASVAALALNPDVQFVEESPEITHRNATTAWIVQSNVAGQTPVWNSGLRGQDQLIGILDGALDRNHCAFVDTDPIGPLHRKIQAYNMPFGADFHGTHVAGIAAGDNGAAGDNRGNAYEARICFGNWQPYSTTQTKLQQHHTQGARLHTNSWGDDGTTAYNSLCVAFDDFQWVNEESFVCLAVTNGSSLKNPENAKNLLAVGNSQDTPNQANHCTGGDGPTSDGRRKPEIYAPGCNTQSASAGTSCGTTGATGTSMASPAIAGVAALVRQYYTEGFYPSGTKNPSAGFVPSAALIKATLLNSTVDMTGVAGYPSNREGWGRVLADNTLYFLGDTRALDIADVRHSNGLSTGGTVTSSVTVIDNTQPLKVTLTWVEPAASSGATNAWINDLDLEVVGPGGQVYKGNVFTGGQSSTGGTKDNKNNVEMVLVNSPQAGQWTVKVSAAAVNVGPQGYALVSSGNLTKGPVPLSISLASPAPSLVPPGTPINLNVVINPGDDTLVSGSPTLFYRLSGGSFTSVPLSFVSGTAWAGTVPGATCQQMPEYYVQAAGTTSGVKTSPFGAPTNVYSTQIGTTQVTTILQTGFESGLPAGSTTSGLWNLTTSCKPGASCDGPTVAYYGLVNQCNFNTGSTTTGTLSIPLDLSAVPSGGTVTLDYCYARDDEGGNPWDLAEVRFSGSPIDSNPPGSPASFASRSVDISALAGQVGTLEFFYDSVDSVANGTLGWMIDGVKVTGTTTTCQNTCYADCDQSGTLNIFDYICFGNAYSAQQSYADCDGNGAFNIFDYICFGNAYAAGCP